MNSFNKNDLLKKLDEISILKKKKQTSSNIIEIVKSFEEENLLSLPDDFKTYLINYDYLSVKDDYYYIPIEKNPWASNDGHETIDLLYGFSNDDSDIRAVFADCMEKISEIYMPIGELSGGNLLCMCINGEDRNKIYFWNHEIKYTNEKEYFVAANSFYELIMSFQFCKRDTKVDLSQIKITLSDDLL